MLEDKTTPLKTIDLASELNIMSASQDEGSTSTGGGHVSKVDILNLENKIQFLEKKICGMK
jgi:hypothetical protein